MSGFYRTMEYLAIKMNTAKDTKQSIITAANSYAYIQKKVKEIGNKTLKEVEKQKPETIHFNPNEIEPIVLKNKNKEDR